MGSIRQQLLNSKDAKRSISRLSLSEKSKLLLNIASILRSSVALILQQNQLDTAKMAVEDPKYDRLLLTEERIKGLANAVESVSKLDDPTHKVLLTKTLENGLFIEKRTVALGVVGVIYESRPNVTVDVAALCIQSGNVCLLRGGSDAWHTNTTLVDLIREVLKEHNVDPNIVQLLPTDRELVHELLTATEYVDILIPRGSQSLIDFVRDHAKVPVIETGAGVCHTYVDATADLDKAAKIIANAKISKPSVCNALDTILVDESVAATLIGKLKPYFEETQVEVFAEEKLYSVLQAAGFSKIAVAEKTDFGREFLGLQCSIASVRGLEEALDHIANFSSKHSECIVSKDSENISIFMQSVDAAAVYANASTRFTDGGEFGLGAEIGISTQKLHARGPFALEKLVTEKWFVMGDGQIR